MQTAVTGLWRTGHVPIHSGASYSGIASQLACVCSGKQWLLCAIPSGQGELSRPWAYAVSVRCEGAVVVVLWASGFLVCSASEGLAQSGAVVELVTTTLPLCPGRSGTAAPVLSPSVAPPVAQAHPTASTATVSGPSPPPGTLPARRFPRWLTVDTRSCAPLKFTGAPSSKLADTVLPKEACPGMSR